MEKKNRFILCPFIVDNYSPVMSFEKFKEIMSKGRDNVSTIVIDEFTEFRNQPTPKFGYSLNPAKDHWATKYLKDKNL